MPGVAEARLRRAGRSPTSPATSGSGQRCDISPPTRKAPLAAAVSTVARRQVGAARVAVHQREGRLHGLDPAGVVARQVGGRVAGRREQAELVGRQAARQHRRGRAFIDLLAGGADPEPDPADPGVDAGRRRQLADEQRQRLRGRLADIQHAERRALVLRQLRDEAGGEGGGIALGEGGGETARS